MFDEVRAWNRENVPGYIEIFLDAPIDLVSDRDPKGIYHRYARGEAREVVGLDIPAEYPTTPDIRIVMEQGTTIGDSFHILTKELQGHFS